MRSRINHVIEAESIDIDADGRTALPKQSKGDMRRALNVLQSAALANDARDITASTIYRTTGQASPEEIKQILEILMNETPNVSLFKLRAIQTERGIALQDMIEGLHDLLIQFEVEPVTLAQTIQRLGEIEYRLAKGCGDEKQLGGLIAAFIFLRESQLEKDHGNGKEPNIPGWVNRVY